MHDRRTDVPRRWLLTGVTLVVLLVAAVAVVVAGSDGDDGDDAVTAHAGATTTVPDPEVLGDVVHRSSSTTTPATVADDPEPDDPEPDDPEPDDAGAGTSDEPPPATTPPTTRPPSTAPPTTSCHNSTDPACGPLSWDPEPTNQEPGVVVVESVEQAVVDEPVRLAVAVEDPDGGAGDGVCEDWSSSDPGFLTTGSCVDVPEDCARFGPHDPPAPTAARTTHGTTVTFTEPGVQTVTVSGFTPDTLPDGCPNPYSSSWTHTFTVTVRSADDGRAEQQP